MSVSPKDSTTLSLPKDIVLKITRQTSILFQHADFKPADKEYILYFNGGALYLTDGIVIAKVCSIPADFPSLGIKLPLSLFKQLKTYTVDIVIGDDYVLLTTDKEESGFELILELERLDTHEYLSIPYLDNYNPDVEVQFDVIELYNTVNFLSSQVDKERRLAELSFGRQGLTIDAFQGNVKFDSEEDQEDTVTSQSLQYRNPLSEDLEYEDAIRYHVNIKYLNQIVKVVKSEKADTLKIKFYENKDNVEGVPFIQFTDNYYLIPYNIS